MLDLMNLSNEMKVLVILIAGGVVGYLNNRYNNNSNARTGVLACVILVSVYLIYTVMNEENHESFDSNTNNSPVDDMDMNMNMNLEESVEDENNLNVNLNNIQNNESNNNVSGSYGVENDSNFKEVNNNVDSNQLPNECYPKDILSPKELLPKDVESTWAQSVPAGQGSLGDQNFLNAGFHIGINTVGQTLRNPNYGLRSEPPNPQVKVSPWMQTTIEPDSNRRAMEIA